MNPTAHGEEPSLAMAARIASRFAVESPAEAYEFGARGNINRDTYLLVCGPRGAASDYLLQRISHEVFRRPRLVMTAMLASLQAQRDGLSRGVVGSDRQWEPITLVPTRDGAPYLQFADCRGTTFWRLMVKIADCRSYKSLAEAGDRSAQLATAREAGRALATYGDLTCDMDAALLVSPLPGYRDTRVYYDQLAAVLEGSRTLEKAAAFLPADDTVRASTQEHFVVHLDPDEYEKRRTDPEVQPLLALAAREREFGLTLLREMEAGSIRRVGIHGDTKLENFLFSTTTGQAKALVDLDTIVPHTWLADWGDMVRSLANVAGEKERDVDRVQVDMEVYEAVTQGFLSSARRATAAEVDLMVEAVEVIALELGVRFLTDYLRGDTYFQLNPTEPPDLNKVRGRAQLTLFERLRGRREQARALVRAATSGRRT